jgi:hypothetical protein
MLNRLAMRATRARRLGVLGRARACCPDGLPLAAACMSTPKSGLLVATEDCPDVTEQRAAI